MAKESERLLPASLSAAAPSHRRELFGLACMAASGLCMSVMALLVRLGSPYLPTPAIILSRALVQLVGSLASCAAARVNPLGPPPLRRMLLLRGLFGFGGISCYYFALRFISLADATVVVFTGPIMVLFLAAAILGEPLEATAFVAVVVNLVGVATVALPRSDALGGEAARGPLLQLLGVALALGQALFSSLAYVLIRKIGPQVHPMVNVFYFAVVVGALAPLEAALLHERAWKTPTGGVELAAVLGTGVFALLGNTLLTLALQHARAGPANLMRGLQVVFAFILGAVVLHERPTALSLFGAALILLSTLSTAVRSMLRAPDAGAKSDDGRAAGAPASRGRSGRL